MTNELKVFENSEFGELGVLVVDGKEYFPATECAKMLGYKNPHKAIKDHCKIEGVNEMLVPTKGGSQKKKFINEGNLYRLIVKSKLPSAEKFETWVFDEVLPTIRKTGGYVSNSELMVNTYFGGVNEESKVLIKGLLDNIEIQQKQLSEQKPKVDYHDKVLSASYLKTTTDIAKDLGMSARKLNGLLNEKGVIYPKKVNGKTKGWYFYSEYDHLVPEYADYHITKFGQSLKWSEKGRKYIIDLLIDEVKDVAFARDNEIDLIDDNDTPDINDIRYN